MSQLNKKKFSRFYQNQKQTNVGHCVTNEIFNGDYKNIEYKLRISAVSAFERKSKVVDDFA